MVQARRQTAKPYCSGRQILGSFVPQSSIRSLFRHSRGVRCALGIDHGPHGEAAMSVVLNDLLLFFCLTALVTGILIAAATLII